MIFLIKEFLKYYKPYRKTVVLIIFGSCLVAILDLIFPACVRNILNIDFINSDVENIAKSIAFLFVLYILNSILIFSINYYGHIMSVKIESDMRRELFSHIEQMPFSFFDNNKTGQILARITSDLTEIGELTFRGPNDVFVCLISMLGTICVLFWMNIYLGGLITLLLLIKTLHTIIINHKMKKAFRNNRSKNGEMVAKFEEILKGIRVVKTFARESQELDEVMKKNNEYMQVRKKSFFILAYFSSSVNFFSNFINLSILALGILLIIQQKIRLSDFIAFLLYVNLFMKPLLRLTVFTEMYQRGMAGFSRFIEIMSEKNNICDENDAIDCKNVKGVIVFDNVSFGYAKDDKVKVLNNINLKINSGEKVAFVGATGAGKTSLINLLLRFYEPQSGKILLDGINIKKYKQQSLRRNIGLVSQDVFLFSDSIKHNILYGVLNGNEQKMKMAAQASFAEEFIEKLPDTYDTFIGEHGVKLSGGQKQRIAIARVFCKNPPIVIFDEATSALDNTTEKFVQTSMEKLVNGRTTIIIAHRLSTIKNVDRVFVLKKGEIIEQGSPNKLYELKGEYYNLCNSIES